MNNSNRIESNDEAIHSWYRFVLSYPPHLVRHYISDFGIDPSKCVLDPFCGTGTTNVECMKNGIPSVGIEANVMTYFASSVKTSSIDDRAQFLSDARSIAEKASERMETGERKILDDSEYKLLIRGSIDDDVLSNVMILKDSIDVSNSKYRDHYNLALAKCAVNSFSNLRFSPEISVVKNKPKNTDVPGVWLNEVLTIASDWQSFRTFFDTPCTIYRGDARDIESIGITQKIDAVITSPPYPNEKDYSRTTRLETVILGFAHNQQEMRSIKQQLLRSNTKNIYKGDSDSDFVLKYPEIVEISQEIEARRIELNRNSGFERLYSRVFLNYFGGMARHLISLKSILNPGAKLAYVVGDQGSYYKIPIRTAELLGIIAEDVGYKVDRIDTFRTRFATGSGEYLNENVLILTYKG